MRLSGILAAALSFLLSQCAESRTINKLTVIVDSTKEDRNLRGSNFTEIESDNREERGGGVANEVGSIGQASHHAASMLDAQALARLRLMEISGKETFEEVKRMFETQNIRILIEAFDKEMLTGTRIYQLIIDCGLGNDKANEALRLYHGLYGMHDKHPRDPYSSQALAKQRLVQLSGKRTFEEVKHMFEIQNLRILIDAFVKEQISHFRVYELIVASGLGEENADKVLRLYHGVIGRHDKHPRPPQQADNH